MKKITEDRKIIKKMVEYDVKNNAVSKTSENIFENKMYNTTDTRVKNDEEMLFISRIIKKYH